MFLEWRCGRLIHIQGEGIRPILIGDYDIIMLIELPMQSINPAMYDPHKHLIKVLPMMDLLQEDLEPEDIEEFVNYYQTQF